MKYKNSTVLIISAQRPQFPTKAKTERIERYFAHFLDSLKRYWETNLYPRACTSFDDFCSSDASIDKFSPWQTVLKYTVTMFDPPLISIRLDLVQKNNEIQPLLNRFGETWDCTTGYPRTLRSFFPPHDHKWKKRLLDSLKEQATQQLSSGESLLDKTCTEVMERAFDPSRFYLSQDRISIFYPQCILGPRAEGIPDFTIPFQSLLLTQKDCEHHP